MVLPIFFPPEAVPETVVPKNPWESERERFSESYRSNLDLRRPVFSRSCCGRPGEPLNKALERPKSVQVYALIHVYTMGLEFQPSYRGSYTVSVLSTQLALHLKADKLKASLGSNVRFSEFGLAACV